MARFVVLLGTAGPDRAKIVRKKTKPGVLVFWSLDTFLGSMPK